MQCTWIWQTKLSPDCRLNTSGISVGSEARKLLIASIGIVACSISLLAIY